MTRAREWLWWVWSNALSATVCRVVGHKTDEWSDVLGCCVRCFHSIPQSAEGKAILMAALAAWDERQPNDNERDGR